ncbi:hypothetical protein HG530_002696 [Fusarium avenaceum]|nr:hypothetical protein HG530_002696 [Fusarium avenaceum]
MQVNITRSHPIPIPLCPYRRNARLNNLLNRLTSTDRHSNIPRNTPHRHPHKRGDLRPSLSVFNGRRIDPIQAKIYLLLQQLLLSPALRRSRRVQGETLQLHSSSSRGFRLDQSLAAGVRVVV